MIDPTLIINKSGSRRWWVTDKRRRENGQHLGLSHGARTWYLNGKRHRTDGPAIERVDGTREWYLHDKRHRTDGPAVKYPDGYSEWWINDTSYNFLSWCNMVNLSNDEITLMCLKYGVSP